MFLEYINNGDDILDIKITNKGYNYTFINVIPLYVEFDEDTDIKNEYEIIMENYEY